MVARFVAHKVMNLTDDTLTNVGNLIGEPIPRYTISCERCTTKTTENQIVIGCVVLNTYFYLCPF